MYPFLDIHLYPLYLPSLEDPYINLTSLQLANESEIRLSTASCIYSSIKGPSIATFALSPISHHPLSTGDACLIKVSATGTATIDAAIEQLLRDCSSIGRKDTSGRIKSTPR